MVGEVRATTGVAHHADLLEVATQVRHPPGLVRLDERQGLIQAREHVGSRDVGARIVHHHGEAPDVVNAELAKQPTEPAWGHTLF